MKLQIKTLNKKSLLIEIEDTKSVLDLKHQLSLYPDVGVKPEYQKLVYTGKVLANKNLLASYNIDEKKFLVVMILKQPEAITEEEPAAISQQTISEETAATTITTTKMRGSPPQAEKSQNDQMIERIVTMGYAEAEVRKALIASFYNPERAIEYLIEGIPAKSTTDFYTNTDAGNDSISTSDVFSRDALLRDLRRSIRQHPDLIQRAIQQIGEVNPSIMNMINENPQEFLGALLDDDDAENDVVHE